MHYSAQRAHKIETTLAVARAPEAPSAPAWPGLEEDACRVLKAHVAVAWFLARRPQLDLSSPHISHDQRTLWQWRHPSGVTKRRSNTLWICLPSRKRGIAQHYIIISHSASTQLRGGGGKISSGGSTIDGANRPVVRTLLKLWTPSPHTRGASAACAAAAAAGRLLCLAKPHATSSSLVVAQSAAAAAARPCQGRSRIVDGSEEKNP